MSVLYHPPIPNRSEIILRCTMYVQFYLLLKEMKIPFANKWKAEVSSIVTNILRENLKHE